MELPPAQRRRLAAPTTIAALTGDLLIHVLLRLPSLPALVRAACTCRAFRDLASDPDFRRRFRATHPAPLLGFFFNQPHDVFFPAIPSFAPVPRDDADLARVLLSGDFFLTPLYVGQSAPPYWEAVDARCGHLLLMDWRELRLAVLNPLERKVERFFDLVQLGYLEGMDGGPQDQILEPRLICFEDYPSMFFVCCLFHNDRRVRVAAFSHEDEVGALLPWMDVPGRPNPGDARPNWLENGMQAGVFIYYFYQSYQRVIVLDITRLALHAEEVHPSFNVHNADHYMLGEDVISAEEHSSLPLVVYAAERTIGCKVGGAPGSLSRTWTIDNVKDLAADFQSLLLDIPMQLPQGYGELVIVALRDGFVYFTTSRIGEHENVPCWFASLNMETGQVDRLLRRTYDASFQPYVMPWPPFLLGVQDDDGHDDNDDRNDQNNDNMDEEQEGSSATPEHPTSSTGKQLSEQPGSSNLEPAQDMLQQDKAVTILLDHQANNERQIKEGKSMLQSQADKAFSRKEYDMVADHAPDEMQYSKRSLCMLQIGDGVFALSDAYQCRMMQPGWGKACYRQAAGILKEYKQACQALLDAQKLAPGNEVERELRKDMELMKISPDGHQQ